MANLDSDSIAPAPAFKDHFSAQAEAYAARRPTYPLELVDLLANAAPATTMALDCGCGSGQLSILLAERFDRVIATDASSEQLARAAAHPRVTYRCATAEKSGLDPASVDLVVAAQAAHWFDLPSFYDEVRRVGRPGAAVALVTYKVPSIDEAADRLIGSFHDETIGPYWPKERWVVVDGYRALPFPFAERPVIEIAMTLDWSLAAFLGYVDTWSGVRRAEDALGYNPIQQLREQLTPLWGAPEALKPVRWTLSVRLGTLSH